MDPAPDKAHPDQALVPRIAASDRTVLERVYRECLGPVEHYITRNSGDAQEARDVFQEALTVVFHQARAERLELTASLSTYLQAICRRLWLKQLRKKGRAGVTSMAESASRDEGGDLEGVPSTPDLTTADNAITEAMTEHDKRTLFRKHFAQLGEDCRKLLGLFFDGVAMAKAAEKMGYASEGYAKKRKFQCKEKLVAAVKADPLYAELMP